MPVAGGGFEQCYNAQAVVAADSLLVVAAQGGFQAPQRQAANRADAGSGSRHCRADLGKPETLLGGQRFTSATPMWRCALRTDRSDDCAWRPPVGSSVLGGALCQSTAGAGEPNALAAMSHRLQTQKQEALRLGKQILEPVSASSNRVMGLPSVLLRGLDQVQGEWSLVTTGLEHEADVRPGGRLKAAPAARAIPFGKECFRSNSIAPSATATMNRQSSPRRDAIVCAHEDDT